ncbi:MAG: phosphoadenylyl-sulfate reductase [Bacteroidetes bacterium]|nr:MAG: phosphoadenylyl-sulfate reductase [Bacteroidota bacterium]
MTSPSIPFNLHADPVTALKELCDTYPEGVVFTTSFGIEDQVLTDLISRNNIKVKLATLDTGRLFSETYDLIDKTKSRYGIEIKSYFPDTLSLEEFVNSQGMNSIFKSLENRKECCKIRKIDPLLRSLKNSNVWVTGLRMEQSDNRSNLSRISVDSLSGLLKFNPLLSWTDSEINQYIEKHNVPINTLHKKGYPSIGCAPCTRAITIDEHPRAGRWWWEQSSKECGLHKG